MGYFNRKGSIIAFLCIMLTVVCLSTFYFKYRNLNTEEDKLLNYLYKNSSEVDKENFNESDFNLLKSDLNKNVVFLSGYNNNYILGEHLKIELDLLKYFNKHAGVRYYLSDMQFSTSEIINKYLETGDESIIKELYSFSNDFSPYDLGPYSKWTSIYDYNKTVGNDKKIRVCGIGFEGYFEHTLMYLNMIVNKDNEPSESIKETVSNIKNFKSLITDIPSYKSFATNINISLQENAEDYKNYLDKDYENFKYVISNIISTLDNFSEKVDNDDFNKIQQNYLYKNFTDTYKKLGGKYYGSFQPLAINQKNNSLNLKGYKFFGEMLNSKDSPVNKRVLSINFLYKNCLALVSPDGRNTYNNIISLDSDVNALDLIDKASNSNITLFKLNGFNSPFKKSPRLLPNGELDSTVDYFQYAIFMKDIKPKTFDGILSIDEGNKKSTLEYLKNNRFSVDISSINDINSFKFLDNELNNYELFFTGESHAVSANSDAMLAFLKYLNKNAGVNYYLFENSYSAGVLINKYLKTGDINLLKSVYSELNGTFEYNINSYNNWIKLYEYNKNLPKDKKITVIGIDIEHHENITWNCLNHLIDNKSVPAEITDTIDIIKNRGKSSKKQTNSILKQIVYDDIQKKEAIYKSFLGEDYFDFVMIVRNLMDTKLGNNVAREATIYKNFNLVYSHYPKGKYFGQFGREHIYLKMRTSQYIPEGNFVSKLNKDGSPFKGKILSIPYIYFNCKRMDINGGTSFVSESLNDILMLYDSSQWNATLYKLNGENSPFMNHLYLVTGAEAGVTTDYFQYVFTIKDSPASEIYNPQ